MTRQSKWGLIAAVAAAVLVLAGYVALTAWSTLTIKGDFYESLGMAGAYETRWHATVVLWVIGAVAAGLLAIPILFLGGGGVSRGRRPPEPGPHPGEDASDEVIEQWSARREAVLEWELAASKRTRKRTAAVPRVALVGGWAALTVLLTLAMGGRLAASRDGLLAARDVVLFGVTDPIFGRDISFFVFTVPAYSTLLGAVLSGLVLSLVAHVAVGVGLARALALRGQPTRGGGVISRTTTFGLVWGGLILVCAGGLLWLSRFGLVSGGDDTIAGAGKATDVVDIPTRTIASFVIVLLGLLLIALATPALRPRFEVPIRPAVMAGAGLWIASAIALAVVATPWWIVLAIPAALVGAVSVRAAEEAPELAKLPVPVQAWAGYAVATAVVLAILGPAGAAGYDGVLLRGSPLQVERSYIGYTLEATRRASGIDQAEKVDADYERGGVTQAAIEAAPASVGSLRFLDAGPTQQACLRLQTLDQFYTCDDVDVDRYQFDGRPVTVFSMGREIDYTKAPDFQRRHFTYTHGYGLILAPVNEIDPQNGRPRWIAGSIPQVGLDPALTQAEIYFGAQLGQPWAIVNTDQPVFAGPGRNERVDWKGTTGIRVGSGWHRLALTRFLGGLPLVGGGRRVWNATGGRPAGPDAQVLLYRDILTRAAQLAPFLTLDPDPYFAAAGGRMYVLLNGYVASARYPYAAAFGGARYMRNAVVVAVDAYSGETKLYVVDEAEPITATWRRVYPELFTPLAAMPEELRTHLRYGERLFDYQSQAAERFHVSSVDVFFNNNEAWAPTTEITGPGAKGVSNDSPARYTYAVLPGENRERFVVMRSYKPAARNRGIGFSGWFAVDNEPDSYGRAKILSFAANAEKPLDSLDVFTANVGRDAALNREITLQADSVVRGNTIVVPIGKGLLYTQPLYLDSSSGDSLPTLWQVVVSFGDGRVFTGSTFQEALRQALRGGGTIDTPSTDATLEDLIQTAAEQWDLYRAAFGRGDVDAAATALSAFQAALARARVLAGGAPTPAVDPATTTPTTTTP